MPADLLVKGQMLRPDGTLAPGAFAVLDGRVVEAERARETLDVGDLLVVPGAIDPHVHFRDPGHPEKEDFGSGTRAAALGGVTTVLDMPNTAPPVFTREALQDKLARAQAKACVDFGLYAGLDASGGSLAILPEATALKIYLGATTGNLLVRDFAVVRRALEAAAACGRTVAVHAESQECLEQHAHLAGDDYPSHSASRPAKCEAEAIREVGVVARGTRARVHVAHLSTRAGLDALQGTGFSAEVTPHHLLLDAGRLREGGRFKMNPPLRARDDAETLLHALENGRVACLASDHAPHTPAEKDAARMPACPAGVPGVQTLVAVLMPLVREGTLPLHRLVRASTAAADLFGLAGKGALAPGHDADFAVYDLSAVTTVRGADLASKAGWSPFEGMPAVFPRDVFVRGQAAVRDGKLVGEAGSGRFVRPRPEPEMRDA